MGIDLKYYDASLSMFFFLDLWLMTYGDISFIVVYMED